MLNNVHTPPSSGIDGLGSTVARADWARTLLGRGLNQKGKRWTRTSESAGGCCGVDHQFEYRTARRS